MHQMPCAASYPFLQCRNTQLALSYRLTHAAERRSLSECAAWRVRQIHALVQLTVGEGETQTCRYSWGI